MSNLTKSSSRFSGRRFAIVALLVIFSSGAAQADDRKSATTVNAPAAPLAELVQDALEIFCRLTGALCGEQNTTPAHLSFGPQTESEIDTEIEVDPPTYP